MNVPCAQTNRFHPAPPLVGFWRQDLPTRSLSIEAEWRDYHSLALLEGIDSARRWLDLVHPDDRPVLDQAQNELVDGTASDLAIEYRIRAHGRGWFWVMQRGQVVDRGTSGQARALAGVIVAVDAEKRLQIAEQALQALHRQIDDQANKLQTVADYSSDWLLLFDTQGDCQFVNRSIMGMHPAQLVGKQIDHFTPPHDIARIRALFQRTIEMAEPVDMHQVDLRSADGPRYFEYRLRPVVKDGRVTAVVATIREHTAQRELERDLLDIASREQQRIGSDLHDGIGQELTGAMLMLQGCQRDLTANSPQHADVIVAIVAQLGRTIDNARTLARGLSSFAGESSGLAASLQELAKRLNRRAGPQLRFTNRLTAPLSLQDAAAQHLWRIAQEAVSNALKHSAATDIWLELGAAADGIYLTVRDNGRGFTDEQVPARGLGLRLMEYRARLLAADLTRHSAPVQGTTITVRCPVNWSRGNP
jgi:PAS domain S-box-containing protein